MNGASNDNTNEDTDRPGDIVLAVDGGPGYGCCPAVVAQPSVHG